MRYVLCAVLCAIIGFAGGETVTIGSGTLVNQSLPWEAVSEYSYSQQLYLASEIDRAGSITSIAFQYNVVSNTFWGGNNQLTLWLGHTSRTQMDGWTSPDSLQQVFGGTLAMEQFSAGLPGNGWLTVILSSPFAYDGQHNLVLAALDSAPGHGSTSDEFYCTSASFPHGRVLLNPNPIDPQNLPAQTLYTRQSYSNLRLEMDVPHHIPCQPEPLDGAQNVPSSTSLSWTSDCATFDLWLGTAPDTLQLQASGFSTPTWHSVEPLSPLRQYWWRVVGYLDNMQYTGPLWSFTTEGEQIGPPTSFSAVCVDGVARLAWQAPTIGNPEMYLIYRDGNLLDETTGLFYWDSNVLPGFTYIYYVKCRNSIGQISPPTDPASVHIPAPIPDLILEQGFEDLTPFSTDIPGWTVLDLDGNPTWGWDIVDFPGEGNPQGWMVFSPQQTTPPLATVQTHSGFQMLMSPDATTAPDNNWLISPSAFLGESPHLRFWARSATAQYGLERLEVLISSGSTLPQDFIRIHTALYISVPTAWTEYDFDLAQWQNTHARLAIRAVSASALALFVDDIVITGTDGSVPNADPQVLETPLSVYPNPSKGSFCLSGTKGDFDLCVYDLRGRKVFSASGLNGFDSSSHALQLPSGIYFLQIRQGKATQILRLAIVK